MSIGPQLYDWSVILLEIFAFNWEIGANAYIFIILQVHVQVVHSSFNYSYTSYAECLMPPPPFEMNVPQSFTVMILQLFSIIFIICPHSVHAPSSSGHKRIRILSVKTKRTHSPTSSALYTHFLCLVLTLMASWHSRSDILRIVVRLC